MDERRKWVRVPCGIFCGYDDAPSRPANSPEIASSAIAQDLSEGGARLVVFEFLPVGRRVRCRLEIPHVEPVEALMEIMWVHENPNTEGRFEVGARFTALAEGPREKIRNFLYSESLSSPKRQRLF